MARKKIGEYTVVGNANVWPHELRTADALKNAGHNVKFIPASNREDEHTADCYVDGVRWEMKAPDGASLAVVERNLRRGLRQANKIVFDSRRVKKIPDKAIQRELSSQLKHITELEQIMFVNRHGEVIDIE